MNKTVREIKNEEIKSKEMKVGCSWAPSIYSVLFAQDSYEMFVEMDKTDGEVDVKIKKNKKMKKKERLENMKKEMDIVSGRKLSHLCDSRDLSVF